MPGILQRIGLTHSHLQFSAMTRILCFALVAALVACSATKKIASVPPPVLLDENTFKVTSISTDKTYGYSEKNPVKVGNGPKNARRYLNALAGPHGEKISYTRIGSCCTFKTATGYGGIGQLDKYRITWPGQAAPILLYVNMFDLGELKSPSGFTIAPVKATAPSAKSKK
jgi:hypothetical protein